MAKVFLDVSIKNKEETYEKFIEMSRNNDYSTGKTNCNRFEQTILVRKS